MVDEKLALVFTMHKTGSSSVMQTLRSIGRNPGRGYAENLDDLAPLSQWEKVITAVRDPIARNISFFFTAWPNYHNIPIEYYPGDLMEEFHKRVNEGYPLRFFYEVFAPAFGIDVYEHKFNRSKGYVIIDDHYLVIRMDKMRTKLKPAIIELFDLPAGTEVDTEHRALTSERPYGKLYDKFVSEAMFDHEYLTRMYDSKYAQHFFTKKEIEGLKQKWMIKTG